MATKKAGRPPNKKQTHEQHIREKIDKLGIDKTLRCRDWRIDNLYKIKDKDGNIVTFTRNRAQVDFDKNKWWRNIILKARQLGFSTLECICALDQALFTPNQSNLIIAHTVPDAKKLFSKMEFAWNNLPSFIREMVYLKSKTTSEFVIGFDKKQGVALSEQPGKIVSTVGVGTSGMSGTYSRVHVTELAYLDKVEPNKAEEIMQGTVPAVPSTGRMDIESTARGDYGEFAELYMDAENRKTISPKEFKTHFYNWQWDDEELSKISKAQIKFVTDGEGQEWRRFQEYQKRFKLTDKEITCYYFFWIACAKKWDRLRQEYPTTSEEAFASGDDRVFSGEALDQYELGQYSERGGWRYYHMPEVNCKYVVGVDPAEGMGKDPHAIVVLKISGTKPEVVATYKNSDISPTALAYEVLGVCRLYNSAMASVELNNSGHATLGQLTQIYEHHRIYQEITKEKSRPNKTKRFGWRTTGKTKYAMVYDFEEAVREFHVELNDDRLIKELRFYTKETVSTKMGRTELKLGVGNIDKAHFDLAMAIFIAWQTRGEAMTLLVGDKPPNPRQKELELRRSFA